MTGWIIFGAVLLLILFILRLTATVVVDYNGELLVKITVLGIKVYTHPSAKKRRKKAKSKPKNKKNKTKKTKKKVKTETAIAQSENIAETSSENTSSNSAIVADKEENTKDKENKADEKKADKKEKPTIKEIIDLVKVALESLGKPLKKLLKRISVSHLAVTAVCGGEDAAKAAMNYGTANFLLGTALNLLDEWFTLKEPDMLKIDVDFHKEEVDIDAYGEVRVTVGSALAFALVFLLRGWKRLKSHSEAKSALEKLIGNTKK